MLLAGGVIAAALMHLLGIGVYPLLGTTEGRYAEMARKMVVSGQYLVPMFTDTLPFWGKPPLSIWLTAVSFNVFGINEFAARLPVWICSSGTIAVVFWFIARTNLRVALLSVLIYTSSLLGYTAFAKVHTDSALTFSVALALVGFYEGITRGSYKWLFIGYVAVGLGLLSKGPVIFVFVGLPMLVWLWQVRRLRGFLRAPSTALGALLVTIIAAPWYVAAELKFPGFLEYYLVGEHFQRFVDSGWPSDLYGAGHAETRGTIILFAVESLLPWSLLIPFFGLMASSCPNTHWREDPQVGFLLAWATLPIVFFCLSANVVPTYVMPTMAAWSVLLATGIDRRLKLNHRRVAAALVAIALVLPAAKLSQNLNADSWYVEARNQKPLVDRFHALRESATDRLIYAGRRRYAAEFYSDGIEYVNTLSQLPVNEDFHLATRHERAPFAIPPFCKLQVTVNTYQLYHCVN